LTDEQKNASVREVQNNENNILLNSQTVFPVKSYRINSTFHNIIDLKAFYQHCQKNIIEIVKHCMIEYRAIKFNLRVYGTYIKQTDEGVTVEITIHFGTAYKSVYQNENIIDELNMAVDSLLASNSEFQCQNSGGSPNPGVRGEKLDPRKPDICPCCSHLFRNLLQNISSHEC